ncbi:3-mercaptopyruvate sulfurtransferase [Microbulbifer aggregans]|uniref:3-mercaptopyruvate sulfurtransferase n=1 Tax=Microbulbifer aggregans TaxID=1769779 RepID=A0A1C9WAC4_9GAMM|nr:sulfurtransferase [Microbulbifer aggregans]AOS98092.1 3-mercaptopyruvate sulfurtransferase [Microbulbifer aggregans]
MTRDSALSVAELAEALQAPDTGEDRRLVVLDCRFNLAEPGAGRSQYAAGHIPGAVYASLDDDLSGPVQRFGGRHPLPSPDQFQAFARRAGIGAKTHVVVYDDQRLAFAARAWWLLRYFGHDSVSVLDGGFAAWKAAGQPLESGSTPGPQAQGNFVAHSGEMTTVHYDAVFEHVGNPPWRLVDARESSRFAGHQEPIDPLAGHIPGAVNKPWQSATNEDGSLKSEAELKHLWRDLPSEEPLVHYCGSGVTACVNLFVQHRIGRKDGLLYPGSWSDWCAHILYPYAEQSAPAETSVSKDLA